MGDERNSRGVFPTAGEWARLAQIWAWSERETQVIRLLVTGTARKEAAHHLGISVNTLHTHVRRALQKCGRHDLVSLVWHIVDRRDQLRAYRLRGTFRD
jgi:DNA-binding NarL/FixJ family response regulator